MTQKRKISEPEVPGITKVSKPVQGTMEKAVQVSLLKCEHCKIHFEDDILFAIHRGWHNLLDPFQCNMCGEQCDNRHGFYSHLARYHTK